MTFLNAIGIVLVACLIVGAMVWSIHTAYSRAERRLQGVMSRALADIDDGRLAAQARSRALDLEYQALVAAEQGNR
jgi:hypothetical protein